MELFGRQNVTLFESALNRTSLRQQVISENIANVDTPNYKAKNVVFKNELDRQLKAYKTSGQHIDFSTSNNQSFVVSKPNNWYNHNGNNVDIDKEMSNMAQNQIEHYALIDRLKYSFNDLKLIARGGK